MKYTHTHHKLFFFFVSAILQASQHHLRIGRIIGTQQIAADLWLCGLVHVEHRGGGPFNRRWMEPENDVFPKSLDIFLTFCLSYTRMNHWLLVPSHFVGTPISTGSMLAMIVPYIKPGTIDPGCKP